MKPVAFFAATRYIDNAEHRMVSGLTLHSPSLDTVGTEGELGPTPHARRYYGSENEIVGNSYNDGSILFRILRRISPFKHIHSIIQIELGLPT